MRARASRMHHHRRLRRRGWSLAIRDVHEVARAPLQDRREYSEIRGDSARRSRIRRLPDRSSLSPFGKAKRIVRTRRHHAIKHNSSYPRRVQMRERLCRVRAVGPAYQIDVCIPESIGSRRDRALRSVSCRAPDLPPSSRGTRAALLPEVRRSLDEQDHPLAQVGCSAAGCHGRYRAGR